MNRHHPGSPLFPYTPFSRSAGTMGFGSPGAARLTGRPADRVLGKTFWTAFPTAKATHVERVLQDVLHDGEPRTYLAPAQADRKSTRLNSSHSQISYAVFCLKKKKNK